METSKYYSKRIIKKKRKAFELYKQGLTVREVGALVDRSRTWVSNAVRELEKAERLVDGT